MRLRSNVRWNRASVRLQQMKSRVGRVLFRTRGFLGLKLLVMIFIVAVLLSLFTAVPFLPHLRLRSSNTVIVVGANKGGGVLQWKGAKEWELERLSIENKKDYAKRHGYHLAIKDMTARRRYTHEWRESWEKVDLIKKTMSEFPDAEWFWWIDLETFIMEPQRRLEDQVYSKIDTFERNVSYYNPHEIEVNIPFLDSSRPVNLIMAQDCGGFSHGSFFMRRSEWTELLLDAWWDPVMYEQRHMEWTHGEQAAFEHLYTQQAWIRNGVAFAPLRTFNAYAQGACADAADDPRFFYSQHDRDFLVNMAGCQWGRDCWREMLDYKILSKKLSQKKFFFF